MSGDRRDQAAARAICRRHARSFYFSSFLLPAAKRRDAYVVYAFCRLLDDAVDEAQDNPRAALEAFGHHLDTVYSEGPRRDDPSERGAVLRALAGAVRRRAIPRRFFEDLATGCRMDLSTHRYPTWAALERYCYHVAGVVGLIMCRVFGLRCPQAEAQAVAMGNAMQLTNILRDVAEDVARGRVYLPREDLDRFGVSLEQVRDGRVNRAWIDLMRFEIDRARGLYRRAAAGLAHLPADGSRQTACAMAVIYSGILQAIERRGYDVFTGRAAVSTWDKCLRLPAALALARRPAGAPVPEVFG